VQPPRLAMANSAGTAQARRFAVPRPSAGTEHPPRVPTERGLGRQAQGLLLIGLDGAGPYTEHRRNYSLTRSSSPGRRQPLAADHAAREDWSPFTCRRITGRGDGKTAWLGRFCLQLEFRRQGKWGHHGGRIGQAGGIGPGAAAAAARPRAVTVARRGLVACRDRRRLR